jgi:hypothetical protein
MKTLVKGKVQYKYTDYISKFRVGDETAKKLQEKANKHRVPVTVIVKQILTEWAENE